MKKTQAAPAAVPANGIITPVNTSAFICFSPLAAFQEYTDCLFPDTAYMIIDPARIQGFEDFLAPAEHAHNLFLML